MPEGDESKTPPQYKALYEKEHQAKLEAEKDRDEAVKAHNALVDQYNLLKAAVADLPIKILGDICRQASVIGHHAKPYEKLGVADPKASDAKPEK